MVVASLPLITEVVPDARGTMMSMNVTAFSLGRAAGAILAPILWAAGGLRMNGLVAGGGTLLALLLLLLLVDQE